MRLSHTVCVMPLGCVTADDLAVAYESIRVAADVAFR